MMRKFGLPILSLALSLALSCSESQSPTEAVLAPRLLTQAQIKLTEGEEFLIREGAITLQTVVAAHNLARAIALSLDDAEARSAIRDEMRDSPFREHKIVLQSFVSNSPNGMILKDALSSRAGLSSKELQGLLHKVPEMDFYLPFRSHRRTWKASADFMIGVGLNVDDSHFTAYDGDGVSHNFNANDGPPRSAILFIHPAERKSLRKSLGGSSGVVVESPPEGGGGLELSQECDEGGCGGGGGSTGTTRLGYMVHFYDDGVGANEPEFDCHHVPRNKDKPRDYGSISEDVVYLLEDVIFNFVTLDQERLTVNLTEDDQFFDDNWGFGDIDDLSEMSAAPGSPGQFNYLSIIGACAAVGDPPPIPCNTPAVNPDTGEILDGFTVTTNITIYNTMD